MAYQPIEDYGLIGNMRTAALVGGSGSIDWLCLPHFDSPSVFARILDDEKGGHFQITPAPDGVAHKQLYWPETNVLITRFLSTDGVAELVDYMPAGLRPDAPEEDQLIRRVHVIRGEMPMKMVCRPAFNYAREEHETHFNEERVVFEASSARMELGATVSLRQEDNGVAADFTLRRGERAVFTLEPLEGGVSDAGPLTPEREEEIFEKTVDFWHTWLEQCTYKGRWREQVYRSALTLKLLTFEPTGAVVAAPTCSLPESIGGVRNWDYRYTWIRDSAFVIYALLRIGFTEEAAAFMKWLEERCHQRGSDALQIVYDIKGGTDLTEIELDHLDGYRGSKPVRIGNGAHDQRQLDIYGELMDAVYLYNKYGAPISFELWTELTELMDYVCEHWRDKDQGIWESRGEPEHFVYSKLMCWVALDRALRLAGARSFPADVERWRSERDAIYGDIIAQGWTDEREAFVQYYGPDAPDASNLIMPLVFFMAANDPRMRKTTEAICLPPEEDGLLYGNLVRRYNTDEVADGLPGDEGTFNMCTFWLVEALTRAGHTDHDSLNKARLLFEKMLGFASPLGLYAEETGHRGEALGNFPQAFTHLGLISAAFNLDRALDGRLYGKGVST